MAGAAVSQQPALVSSSQWRNPAFPAYPPLTGSEPGSFAEGTITARLPAILASTIKDLQTVAARMEPQLAAEVQGLIEDVQGLRQEILAGGPVTAPVLPEGQHVPPALAAAVQCSREALAIWEARTPSPQTWLTLPWLLVECVMYVRLAASCARYPGLTAARFDMFAEAKGAGWAKCVGAAAELAEALLALEGRLADAPQQERTPALEVALFEVVQWSLWGNKTDLSLLVDASGLSPVAASLNQGASLNPQVIVDEYVRVWALLKRRLQAQGPGRVDIVLDNSGLELYGDLLLADFLITQGLAKQVVLHGKPFPWFVSDTLTSDLNQLLSDCGPSSATPPALLAAKAGDEAAASAAWQAVRTMGGRWAQHLDSGAWRYVDHPFWVTPAPFCWMKEAAPQLYADLATSCLVIFKGDLNYRKLVHDCRWPATTPWREALQGFAPAPLLALRTLKADVVAGLNPGQAEQLTQQDPPWLVNGKWGMVQFTE